MKGLLGIKVGMTQLFDKTGAAVPVTIIQAGPCFVTQVKNQDGDGYNAIQVGFGETSEKRLSGGQKGHLALLRRNKKHPNRNSSGNIPAVRYLREFRVENSGEYSVGQQLTVAQFAAGDMVDVTGKSKGRGYTGVIKRWGFSGGPKTHGQSDRWRAPGSVSAASGTGHVFKGKKMAGRSGNARKTIQNLQVMRIDSERNLIAIKGAIPGAKGGLVIIRGAVKNR